MQRLVQAFSLRRNLHHLITPSPGQVRTLDGLRAFSMLWMVAFHSIYFIGFFVSRDTFLEVLRDGRWSFILHGHYGVDVFFVLSGFLIANMLLREQARTGEVAVGRFYARRLLRLMPVYVVMLGLYAVTIRERSEMCWTNLLHINNFWPVSEQCMGWAWSLAIEEQFYLVFPVILLVFGRVRRFLWPSLFFLFVLGFVIRAVVITRGGASASEALHPIIDGPSYFWGFDNIYDKPYTRYGALLVGVAVAYALHHSSVIGWLNATGRRQLAVGGVALALAILSVMTVSYTEPRFLNATTSAFVASVGQRYVFAISVGLVIVLSLAEGGPLRWLGTPLLHPVAQLSYSGYLVHPIVIAAGYFLSVSNGVLAMPIAAYITLFIALTLLLSVVIYLLVERPFMNLRD